MAQVAPGPPTRFPCWVQAVYSWGGETKRDLGFLEGDLIECLNAGDGSWWTGRLRRDPRMIGSFPSNFVQVLNESFVPPSRSPSPLPPPPVSKENKALQKSKTWRKPFQAYQQAGAPNPEAAARQVQSRMGVFMDRDDSRASRKPYSAMQKRNSVRPMSTMVNHSTLSQQRSFNQGQRRHVRTQSSYEVTPRLHSRSPSPNPLAYHGSRAPSPAHYHDHETSPLPPPPPQHRYATSRAASPNPPPHGSHGHGNRTPDFRVQKSTPSPFTEAFNQIMDKFDDMAVTDHAQPMAYGHYPQTGVWSPEDYGEVYDSAVKYERPTTSTTTNPHDSGYQTAAETSANMSEGKHEHVQPDDYMLRMEQRLRELQRNGYQEEDGLEDTTNAALPTLAKDSDYKLGNHMQRPFSAFGSRRFASRLGKQKSAYELTSQPSVPLGRTTTFKSSTTTTTNSSDSTNRSIWSGTSAGALSSASAGSFYNKSAGFGHSLRPLTSLDLHSSTNMAGISRARPDTPLSGPSYHSSHDSYPIDHTGGTNTSGLLGGLVMPTTKKTGFVRRMLDSARATAATARSTMTSAGNHSRPGSPSKSSSRPGTSMMGIAGGTAAPLSRPRSNAAHELGLGGAMDWVQVRRDVHRSNSIGKNERQERAERCQLMDIPVLYPVDEFLHNVEGDEGLDGLPITQPTDFTVCNLQMVDKSARFVSNLPASTTPSTLAQGYLCRPYRSDVQRLRAIFTWVSERIAWEDDFEGAINIRRTLQAKRGSTKEIATLVMEMCAAVGIHAEAIHGYLKVPGDFVDVYSAPSPNHWWTAVIVDGEWRIMDCALASPTNPKRSHYSATSSQVAESWWFLARPTQICYTHVPMYTEQQHIVPPVPNDILLSLPCVCPSYFKNNMEISDFDTSLLHLQNLELAHIYIQVPEDVECVADVQVRALARDVDGDWFESGEVLRKPALAQAQWVGGRKRYTIKTLLPSDQAQGVLNIYAGKRGLMHSIKSNPHPLALALPIHHTGQNPPYNFLIRHPTPHAQRHDLYIVQPQCARLVANNTFVFSVRQNPSSLTHGSLSPGAAMGGATNTPSQQSPNPFARPTSALSIASISASGSNYSAAPSLTSSSNASSFLAGAGAGAMKPAKLAIQSPSGKIIRLNRRIDTVAHSAADQSDGTEWETVIKVCEHGVWRALVLADRSARWCVFAEWQCA